MNSNPTFIDMRNAPPDRSPADDDETEEKIVEYSCPYCPYTDNAERWVRVHITSSSDSRHKGRHGFSPEVTVDALDANGNVVDTPRGIPAQADDPGSVTTELLPEDIADDEREIILTAVRNPSLDSYAELQRLVNKKTDEEVSYNKVYYTVNKYMSKPSVSKSKKQNRPTKKSFDDLSPKQKSCLIELAREQRDDLDRSPRDLADDAGVDTTYVPMVEDKYGYLLDEVREMDELPDRGEVLSENSGFTADDAIEIVRLGMDDPKSETTYGELSSGEQEIVNQLSDNPHADIADVQENVDASPVEIEEAKTQYKDIIERRRRGLLLRPVVHAEKESDLVQMFTALTPKQQSVAVELAKEPTPANPDRDTDTIATYAGVHPTYISKLPDKVIDAAEQLQDLQESQTEDDHSSTADTTSDDEGSDTPESPSEQPLDQMDDTASAEQSSPESAETLAESIGEQTSQRAHGVQSQLDLPTDPREDSPTEATAEPVPESEIIEEVRAVLQTAESLQRVAEMQIESSNRNQTFAHGSKAAAGELQNRLQDIVDTYGSTERTQSTTDR